MPFTSTWTAELGFASVSTRLAEFIRALNERREAIGASVVEFQYWTGTEVSEKSYPDASELDLTMMGAEIAHNMCLLQDEVTNLVDNHNADHPRERFVESSASPTLWTLANIEADIGLGAFPSDEDIVFHDADWWDRIAGAFERLAYVKVWPGRITSSSDGTTDSSNLYYPTPPYPAGYEIAATNAWAGALLPDGSTTHSNPYARIFKWTSYSTAFRSSIEHGATITFDTAKYSGMISNRGLVHFVDAVEDYDHRNTYGVGVTPQSVDVNGSLFHTITTDGAAWTVSGNAVFTIEANSVIQFDWTDPTANPTHWQDFLYTFPVTIESIKASIEIGGGIAGSPLVNPLTNDKTYFWIDLDTALTDRVFGI